MLTWEDWYLLCIHDANTDSQHWLKRWEKGYPLSLSVTVSEQQSQQQWQQQINEIYKLIGDHKVMIVAHSVGCSAFVAWLYQTGLHIQRNIVGTMLVAPICAHWDNEHDILNATRVNFKTALIIGEDDQQSPIDKAQKIANKLGAKLIETPYSGHLDEGLYGWEWGMKLMQDMILN